MVNNRLAFTLIELIFAIVIMSIVMLAFPAVMMSDSDAREKNIAQEAVMAASAKLHNVLTYQWDERSISWDDLGENRQSTARVLDGTNAMGVAFTRFIGTARANQMTTFATHRQFFPLATNATGLGDDNASVAAMDDRNLTFGVGSGFEAGFTTDDQGYKRNYKTEVTILRVHDELSSTGANVNYTSTALTNNNRFIFTQTDAGGQTNLRAVRVSITDENDKLITTLYGYSANIGEYSAYRARK